MKRQSKAEEALRKQVKVIDAKANDLRSQIHSLNEQLQAYLDMADQFDKEISHMEFARRKASERLKP